jgi:hypothetical protein
MFQAFIAQHQYNAAVQNVFVQKRKLARVDLYEPPFSNFGNDAVDRWFTPREVDEVLAFTVKLTA